MQRKSIFLQTSLARVLAEAIMEDELPISMTIGKSIKGEVLCLFEYESIDTYDYVMNEYVVNPLYA